MRPPARPRAAGPAQPSPADQGKVTQESTPRGSKPRRRQAQEPTQEPDRPGRAASAGMPAGEVFVRSRATGRAPGPEPTQGWAAGRPGGRTTPSDSRDDVVSDQLADRLAERVAMARYRVWRRVGWTVAAVVLAAAAVWVVFFSPLFALDAAQVQVTGQGTTVDAEQVREVATEEAGVPLPRIDTVGLREEILVMNGVKNVRIIRSWPDGLTVTLTSREPVAAVPQPGDAYALMDAEGVRVGTVEDVPDDLPSIVVPLAGSDAGRRSLDEALAVLGALPPELADDIRTVSAATQDDVRTTLSDGRVIRWGSGARVELKTRVAQTLLRVEVSARTVDVSSPELPVTN